MMLKGFKIRSLFAKRFPIYIFHHIPKCGGTSMRKVLRSWFDIKEDYITLNQLLGIEPVTPPVDLNKLNSAYCIASHFECNYNHLHVRYPAAISSQNKDKFRIFSIVRDPLQLRLSLYYYEIKIGRRRKEDQALEDYLLSGTNYLADRFPCTELNYKEVLDRYFFIALQEQMQTSLNRLAEILGKRPVRLPTTNQAERGLESLNIKERTVEQFKQQNTLDYLIYEYVKNKFHRDAIS